MFRRPVAVVLATLFVVLGSCKTDRRSAATDTSTPFNRNLAGRPSGTTPGTSVAGTRTTSAGASGAASSAMPSGPTTTTESRVVLDIVDASGDAGADAPAYADIASVELRDLGTNVRVVVRVQGSVPAALESGEVVGIGVDLYRTRDEESDYQLFADGGADGWFAYLDTPKGFVAYPGRFALDASSVRFDVPWTALGGRGDANVGAFLDWTRRSSTGTVAGNDVAPDRGVTPMRA